MNPLFVRVGLGADLSSIPSEERRTIRRGAPEPLRIEPVAPGWPPVRITPLQPPRPANGGWGWLRAVWPGRPPGAQPAR
jgi:hypothetical protein